MPVIITNIRNVSVDGSPVGSLVNAFNESKDPVAVQIALESFCDNLETASKAIAESHAVELAKLTASHAEAIAAKDAGHLEAIAAKDAQLKAQDAEAWDTINAVDEAIAAKDAQLKAQEDEAWEAIKASANNHAAAITELEAQHAADLAAAVEAEGRAVHNRLDALVEAGQQAHAAGDLDALGRVLVSAYAHTSKARKAKLEADLASAQAAVTAAADKLAAL